MKNLILILIILLLGMTSCNKSEEQILPNDNLIFEQLNQQLDGEQHIFNHLKQTTFTNLPEVGDNIYYSFKTPGANSFTSGTVLSIQSNTAAFAIKATVGAGTFYVLASKNQININVPRCNFLPPDYEFLSNKAAAYVEALSAATTGHYDWKSNGGCAYSGIPDVADPSCSGNPVGCPKVDPKIVLFHKDSKVVGYVNW